jgi:hypothetical protein
LPTLNQQVLCFLIGGLLGLLLFRWFFMALTSFLGTTLLAYGILALLHYRETIDAVAWSEENALLLTILCGVGSLFGFGFQFFLDRRRERKRKEEEEEEDAGIASMILGRIGFGSKSSKAA